MSFPKTVGTCLLVDALSLFSSAISFDLTVDSIKKVLAGTSVGYSRYVAYDPKTTKFCVLQAIPVRDVIFEEGVPVSFLTARRLHKSKPDRFVNAYNWFQEGDLVYLVIEYYRQQTLRDIIEHQRASGTPFPEADFFRFMTLFFVL
jgi:serine/threonine protein kinase